MGGTKFSGISFTKVVTVDDVNDCTGNDDGDTGNDDDDIKMNE